MKQLRPGTRIKIAGFKRVFEVFTYSNSILRCYDTVTGNFITQHIDSKDIYILTELDNLLYG